MTTEHLEIIFKWMSQISQMTRDFPYSISQNFVILEIKIMGREPRRNSLVSQMVKKC